MSLIKIAAAKWREVAKRILDTGVKSDTDKQLINLMGTERMFYGNRILKASKSYPLHKKQDVIANIQDNLANAAYKSGKREAQMHHAKLFRQLDNTSIGLNHPLHKTYSNVRPPVSLKERLGIAAKFSK